MPKIRYIVKSTIMYNTFEQAKEKMSEILETQEKRNEKIVQVGIEEVISQEELR